MRRKSNLIKIFRIPVFIFVQGLVGLILALVTNSAFDFWAGLLIGAAPVAIIIALIYVR